MQFTNEQLKAIAVTISLSFKLLGKRLGELESLPPSSITPEDIALLMAVPELMPHWLAMEKKLQKFIPVPIE